MLPQEANEPEGSKEDPLWALRLRSRLGQAPCEMNNHSKDQLDLLSLMLQNGHIGWYSVKLVLHLGQYQAMASSRTLISDASQVRAEEPKLWDNSSCVKGRFLNCSFRNHTYRTQIVVLPFRT
jgi:hypothetical protein